MYRFWESIIHPALEVLRPRVFVEIGIAQGIHTQKILQYCKEVGAILHAIDPEPQCDMNTLQKMHGDTLVFHKELSLNALYHIPSYDIVLIDGDHNWYTVFHELLLIEKKAREQKSFPTIFLHDTGWPYGRRDLYYNPENIPPAFCQPHRRMGISPEKGTLTIEGGMNGHLFNAIYEHNIRNGVLTAIEDFLAQTKEELHFTKIPGIHGLGIIVPATLLKKNKTLKKFLSGLHVSEHIAKHFDALESLHLRYTLALQQIEQELHNTHTSRDRLQGELTNIQASRDRLHTQMIATQHEHERKLHLHEKELERMQCSRSWRWTAFLRKGEACFRSLLGRVVYNTVSVLHDIWTDFGEPFPRAARFVRHILLGKRWPSHSAPVFLSFPTTSPSPTPNPIPITSTPTEDPNVAVIITSHNQGHRIEETIESLYAQILKPTEILIVDDASEDATKEIAMRNAAQGIEHLHGTWKNAAAARNAGLKSTESPFLVFLSAGDRLSPDYLCRGIEALTEHHAAAIAYADETSASPHISPRMAPDPFDQEHFERENYLPDGSIVRRAALMQIGGWSPGIPEHSQWITWRRILARGWKAVKIPGTILRNKETLKNVCERHPEPVERATFAATYSSLSLGERARACPEPAEGERGSKENSSTPPPVSSPHRRGNSLLTSTLCLSLSGREWMWPLTREFLEKQIYPHGQTHLVIIDTAQDTTFGNTVQAWLKICDYGKHTYLPLSVGIKGLADLPRRTVKREVASACALIYNSFTPFCKTPWIFFLEDDVIPPLDAYPRLLQHFIEQTVSVSALCMQRMHAHPIAWEWDKDALPVPITEKLSGVTPVGGNGFCCAVLRGEYVREATFRSGPFDLSHDHNFYRSLIHEQGLQALIDWSCVCRHYLSPHEWM